MNAANDHSQTVRRSGRRSAADIDENLVPIVEAILQSHHAVRLDEMTDILQDSDSLINKNWKQGDEDAIEAQWQASRRKKSSDHVGTRDKNGDPLRDLWRVCVRFFKQMPPLLFSPFNRLQFVPNTEKASAVLSCRLFSKEACSALADLIAARPTLTGSPFPTSTAPTQDGQGSALSQAGAQDRLINELKASIENLSDRLSETDRKVERHETLIRRLQEENRVLKQQVAQNRDRPLSNLQ
ncbi:uncharacterized protein FPRN_09966 [Fusarium proliferatum]|nr:uncharacterized protein FPRN_09966 [Fusarium proliferatum]